VEWLKGTSAALYASPHPQASEDSALRVLVELVPPLKTCRHRASTRTSSCWPLLSLLTCIAHPRVAVVLATGHVMAVMPPTLVLAWRREVEAGSGRVVAGKVGAQANAQSNVEGKGASQACGRGPLGVQAALPCTTESPSCASRQTPHMGGSLKLFGATPGVAWVAWEAFEHVYVCEEDYYEM